MGSRSIALQCGGARQGRFPDSRKTSTSSYFSFRLKWGVRGPYRCHATKCQTIQPPRSGVVDLASLQPLMLRMRMRIAPCASFVSLCRLLFWPSLVLVNTLGTPTAVHATVAIPAPSGGGGGGALPTEARLLFGPAYRTVALRRLTVSTRVPARTLANPIARCAYSSTRLVPLFPIQKGT